MTPATGWWSCHPDVYIDARADIMGAATFERQGLIICARDIGSKGLKVKVSPTLPTVISLLISKAGMRP